MRERLNLLNIEQQLFATLQHDTIRVDAARLKAIPAQDLEPLATPTTDVQNASRDRGVSQHGQINLHCLFDLLGSSSQRVFEREIHRIEQMISFGERRRLLAYNRVIEKLCEPCFLLCDIHSQLL